MSKYKNKIYSEFVTSSAKKSFDTDNIDKIKNNIVKYTNYVEESKKLYCNIELAKKRAAVCKNRVLNELDKYLIEFEANFIKKGGKVIWAQNNNDVIKEILNITQKNNIRKIVKSKSMISEEIGINEVLEKNGIELFETNTGEFINQLTNDKSYHIVSPALHKSKQDISILFNKKYGLSADSTIEEIIAFIRDFFRNKFVAADVGITGCNFLIAETGAVCISENEGNALLSTSFPRIHIVITGIEKILPALNDLDLFLPLLATNATGQPLTSYNTIYTGPKQDNESDGPEEMYVILLDNKRTNLLAQTKQRMALACIHCGACLNSCPVYKNIGGHTYGVLPYSGPIAAVAAPWLNDMNDYQHLSFASSLCGKCTDVCPIKIPLHHLLLYNRRDIINKKLYKKSDKRFIFAYKHLMLNRKLLELGNYKIKNFILNKTFHKNWGTKRVLPKFAEKSFNKLWTEKKNV